MNEVSMQHRQHFAMTSLSGDHVFACEVAVVGGGSTAMFHTAKMILALLSCLLVGTCFGLSSHTEDTFHIRHYHGKCLEWNGTALVFKPTCRDHLKWKNGARLFHVPTGKCLTFDQATYFLSLTSNCNGTDTLFQHMASTHAIMHLISGHCIKPAGDGRKPGTRITFSSNCSTNSAKFWLVPQVLFVIRHFNGFCWKYNAASNLFQLRNTHVCDRFFYRNSKHLRHFATGKCVIPSGGFLTLSSNCPTDKSLLELDTEHRLSHPVTPTRTHCVHPLGGSVNPLPGTKLEFYPACNADNQIRFYFYDDRDILQVTIVSESGDDSASPRGNIFINGYQHSKQVDGMNIVVLDYRSGIVEHISSYVRYGLSSERWELTKLLNSLPPGKIVCMAVQHKVVLDGSLAQDLQSHGISATFATPTPSKAKCSMASVSFTGPNRKPWEMSFSPANCVGKSKIEVKINVFQDLKGINDCSNEMGIRTNKLPDSRLTGSSFYSVSGKDFATKNARLHKSTGVWCSASHAPLWHFIQVDLGAKKLISGLAIQARPVDGMYGLSKYNISYSLDATNWKVYVDESNKEKVFEGLKRSKSGDTSVNWFSIRVLARHVRLSPLARLPGSKAMHCVRMELFGCSPNGPIFQHSRLDLMTGVEYTSASNTDSFSFAGIPPLTPEKVTIGISTAASNASLANDTNQHHIYNLHETAINSVGAILKQASKVNNIKDNAMKTNKSLFVEYDHQHAGYYNWDISVKKKILDVQRKSGMKSWNIYTYETKDDTFIVCHPVTVKRNASDSSVLAYEIQNSTKQVYNHGDTLSFNISISHWKDLSHSNAYKLHLFIYYDTMSLLLVSFKTAFNDPFTINPTRNTTMPGFIHLETDVLWLLNNHFIQFNFTVNSPNQLEKGVKFEGAILTDFSYQNNLEKFNGTFTTELNKALEYKWTTSNRVRNTTSQRIKVPEFSILFDDVNNVMYFCKVNTKSLNRNRPICFFQKKDDISWYGMPFIASVVGIDTVKNTLFGLDGNGNGYIQSENLHTFAFVADDVWTSIANRPHVRQAKTSYAGVTSLPKNLDVRWALPSSSNQIWAATKQGVMKKVSGNWQYKIWW
eukprot:gene15161-16720_t